MCCVPHFLDAIVHPWVNLDNRVPDWFARSPRRSRLLGGAGRRISLHLSALHHVRGHVISWMSVVLIYIIKGGDMENLCTIHEYLKDISYNLMQSREMSMGYCPW